MEKQSKKLDRITQKIIKEGGLHKPSPMFLDKVMDAVTQLEEEKLIYKPLISRNGWILLLLIPSVVILLSVFSNVDYAFLSNFDFLDRNLNNVTIPEIRISKEMIYGIGFLGLFLLQIPFLKKQLDKRYI